MPLQLELNPSLDIGAYARAYARDGIVRIPDVLSPASAETVAHILEKQIPWKLTLSEPDDPKFGRYYDPARIKALGQGALNARVETVLKRARSGFAYMHLAYPMIESYLAGRDPGHPIHEVLRFLNGPDFLNLLRAATCRSEIIKACALATQYRPSDFLTIHNDNAQDAGADYRVCAYTFGFTRQWRADWGGQLLFHDEEGQIARGLAPAFNALTLFTVPRDHSVAPVGVYATAPRLSIVGWGRSDPPLKMANDGVKPA